MVGSLVAAGIAGYLAASLRQNSDFVLPVQRRIPFECYLDEHSFSEIENTKSTLEALCLQYLTDLRSRHDASVLGRPGEKLLSNPVYRVDVAGAIEELQQGIMQFKGTDQELVLVRELLGLLKREKLYDRWLDLYLSTLYEHPTHDLISSRSSQAKWISQEVGREYDLANAIDLLRHIPVQLSAKVQSETLVPRTAVAGASGPWSEDSLTCD